MTYCFCSSGSSCHLTCHLPVVAQYSRTREGRISQFSIVIVVAGCIEPATAWRCCAFIKPPRWPHAGALPWWQHLKHRLSHRSKVLPKPDGPWGGADLHFLSPQPDTSWHCKTMDMGPVYRTVCPFSPQLLLVLIAPTHRGMARLSWPGWLVTDRDGLPVRRRSPIQVLTGPDVE